MTERLLRSCCTIVGISFSVLITYKLCTKLNCKWSQLFSKNFNKFFHDVGQCVDVNLIGQRQELLHDEGKVGNHGIANCFVQSVSNAVLLRNKSNSTQAYHFHDGSWAAKKERLEPWRAILNHECSRRRFDKRLQGSMIWTEISADLSVMWSPLNIPAH